MTDILKQLQAHVDFMAETGRRNMEISFDDLNNAVGEIERSRESIKNVHSWLINAIPINLYGVDLMDEYKCKVFDEIRDWLYQKKENAA